MPGLERDDVAKPVSPKSGHRRSGARPTRTYLRPDRSLQEERWQKGKRPRPYDWRMVTPAEAEPYLSAGLYRWITAALAAPHEGTGTAGLEDGHPAGSGTTR